MERQPAKTFQDLVVWQKSHALTLRVYKITLMFPKYELYGLRYYFILAHDLGYLTGKDAERSDVDEVARLLGAYCRTLLAPSS
jgi:hypothetical protein